MKNNKYQNETNNKANIKIQTRSLFNVLKLVHNFCSKLFTYHNKKRNWIDYS